jgi:hypothetical protein
VHQVLQRERPVTACIADELGRVAAAIAANRYRYPAEVGLQDAIEVVLADAGIPAEREPRLTAADRIDFLAGRVGIEVKIAGRPADVERQLRRYAASPDVDALVLVTTRARHRAMPAVIGGKPVRVVWLSGVTG